MLGSSETWGLNSTHFHGTHVPVEEPSTASGADFPSCRLFQEQPPDVMLMRGVPEHIRSDNGAEMTAKVVRN